MKEVHVECLPDEALVKKLGISKKQITHHSGKSRVFAKMKVSKKQIALVDEDPDSAKCSYEQGLNRISESFGIIEWKDKSDNRILVLKGKLEDWIIGTCKAAKVDLKKDFGLPDKPNDLHDVINTRMNNFEKLIGHLIKIENPAIILLKERLQ
jgi:hypothetical protein